MRIARGASTALVAPVLLASACTATVTGHGLPQPIDPDAVAGLPATAGPNGLRPDAPTPHSPVDGGTSGRIDTIAEGALADLRAFWSASFPRTFHRALKPVDRFVSWDSSETSEPGPTFCGAPTEGIANAGFCPSHDEIGWDRGPLLTGLVDAYGDLAPVVVLAHEYGHVVQHQSGTDLRDTPTIILEQQADCYTGVFLRTVAEGNAAHLTMNTTDGLGSAMKVLVGIRDSPDGDLFGGAEHGSAFERVTAFQLGFRGNAEVCAGIDGANVDARRGNLPINALTHGRGQPRSIDEDALDAVQESLADMFAMRRPPPMDTADPAGGCANRRTAPVTYCADTGTIGIDLPALTAAAQHRPQDGPSSPDGYFTALSMIASRYALASADERGEPVTGETAAARTACLTGAWTGRIAADHDADAGDTADIDKTGDPDTQSASLRMRPGDIDEIVAQLLSGGLVAADADGRTPTSPFSRVGAFRRGFTGGAPVCRDLYR